MPSPTDKAILQWLVDQGGHASLAEFRQQFDSQGSFPPHADVYLLSLQQRRLLTWELDRLTITSDGHQVSPLSRRSCSRSPNRLLRFKCGQGKYVFENGGRAVKSVQHDRDGSQERSWEQTIRLVVPRLPRGHESAEVPDFLRNR